MKGDPEQRAVQLGEYIAANRATVRAAAAVFGCSKSTVHKDLSERLPAFNQSLYEHCLLYTSDAAAGAVPAGAGGSGLQ